MKVHYQKCGRKYWNGEEYVFCQNKRDIKQWCCGTCMALRGVKKQRALNNGNPVVPFKHNGKELCYMKGDIMKCKMVPKGYLWLDLTL